MVYFNGTLRLTICEASDLKATDCATRTQVGLGLTRMQRLIDPYVAVDIDDAHVGRTQSKTKSFNPVWQECFSFDVRNGVNLGLTVFHDAAILPDEFVANCIVPFEDLVKTSKSDDMTADIWVKIIVIVQLN